MQIDTVPHKILHIHAIFIIYGVELQANSIGNANLSKRQIHHVTTIIIYDSHNIAIFISIIIINYLYLCISLHITS